MARQMMEIWWQSMNHPTKMDESSERYQHSWPWEQERLAAYYDAAPDLFYTVQQSWRFFGGNGCTVDNTNLDVCWLGHSVLPPGCCFESKHLIIDDLNVTMTHQVERNSLLSQWKGLSFEELVYNLYQQIPVRQLSMMEFVPISELDPAMAIHNLTIFWNHSLSNNSVSDRNNFTVSDGSGRYRRQNRQSVHPS